ncbi:hypothetical protein GVAV_002704 [Gurleya vavrai]
MDCHIVLKHKGLEACYYELKKICYWLGIVRGESRTCDVSGARHRGRGYIFNKCKIIFHSMGLFN